MRDETLPWRSPGIYPILDLDFCKKKNLDCFELPKLWLEFPDLVPFIQIRAKSASENELEILVKSLQIRYPSAFWILNDHWEKAISLGCFGAHLGKEDFEALSDKQKAVLIDSNLFLGISSHTLEDVVSLDSKLWNYTGFGPVFPTESKEDAKSAVGTPILEKIDRVSPVPVTLIGGIQASNLEDLLSYGSFLLSSISMACLEKEFRAAALKIRNQNR
ncbi:thiamine phosphate synthase [Leptospira sp. WS92.C1]